MDTNKHDLKNQLPEGLNKNPFTVPDNYFEDFDEKIKKRLDDNSKPQIIEIAKPYLSIAAILIGLFIVWNVILKVYLSVSDFGNTIVTEQITDDDVYIDEVDESLFAEMYSIEDTVSFMSSSLADVDTETLIEYLADNESDFDF